MTSTLPEPIALFPRLTSDLSRPESQMQIFGCAAIIGRSVTKLTAPVVPLRDCRGGALQLVGPTILDRDSTQPNSVYIPSRGNAKRLA